MAGFERWDGFFLLSDEIGGFVGNLVKVVSAKVVLADWTSSMLAPPETQAVFAVFVSADSQNSCIDISFLLSTI